MTRRTIRKSSRYVEAHVADLLQGLLVAELLRPSRVIWLASAWVSDLAVIDNRDDAFAGLSEGWPPRWIRLTEVMVLLAGRGTSVVIATNTDEHNERFLQRLGVAASEAGLKEKFTLKQFSDLHVKGLLGDDFYLHGSMNFTNNGVRLLTEEVTLDVDRDIVERARLEFGQWYGPSEAWS